VTPAAFLPSPSANGFHVGPLFVHAYGLAYVVALAAAVAISTRRWRREGGEPTLVHAVALWAFPAGLIGGRLYFLATSWDQVPRHWWGPVAIWDGGLGIWGGVAAGALVGVWRLRRSGVDVGRFADAAAPGLLVAQAIGRVGNYFNQELFGAPTTLPWGLQIDPAHRPPGYLGYATFHPTFLYELIWNLALAAALVWLGHRSRIRPGGLFALYVAGYSLARISEELLRVDPAHHLFGLRLNFYVASALFVAGLIAFVRLELRRSGPPRRPPVRVGAVAVVGALVCLAVCGHGGGQASARPLGQPMRAAAAPTTGIAAPAALALATRPIVAQLK
jgi:prolipoprotein diacylglyceryl transferase